MEGGQEIRENMTKIPPKWLNGQILTVFSSFLSHFHFFLFCWVCLIYAVISNTINLDFWRTKFTTEISFSGDLKLMFCHFSQRRWTFEIIFFGKSVLLLWHSPKIILENTLSNFFIFSHRPKEDCTIVHRCDIAMHVNKSKKI